MAPTKPTHRTTSPAPAPSGEGGAPRTSGSVYGAVFSTLDSRALFQGHSSVAIRHNGVVYRLQATKLGKLILTK